MESVAWVVHRLRRARLSPARGLAGRTLHSAARRTNPCSGHARARAASVAILAVREGYNGPRPELDIIERQSPPRPKLPDVIPTKRRKAPACQP
jgi:hypothetical protein